MDNKLLLVRIITLLYLESLNTSRNVNSSHPIVQEALSYINSQDATLINDFSKDTQTKLRETVQWMMDTPRTEAIDKQDLLGRVRMACEDEDYVYDTVCANIDTELTPEEVTIRSRRERNEIDIFITRNNVKSIFKDIHQMVTYRPDKVDWSTVVKDAITRLEPFKNATEVQAPTLVTSIDLSSVDSIAGAIQHALTETTEEGIIKFGLQGFNRMFGTQGGARRGEMIVVGALQSNFKSGTSLEMIKGAAIYNTPYLRDPSKKALILRYSLENPAHKDIIHMYVSLYEQEARIKIDPKMVDPIIAANYLVKRLGATGYKVHFEHHNPSDLTYDKLFALIEGWEAQGYEIHMLSVDYLAMMSTKGCKQGATGQDIRDLFRRTRNFTEPRGIVCVTPHQLSVDAKKKTREGAEDFVRMIANKGYWDSCSTIDQEVDMEIYQHIERVNGVAYMTWMRGKHRRVNWGEETSMVDQYCVYKFDEVGFFHDDINGPDESMRAVGRASVSDGGAPAWWE